MTAVAIVTEVVARPGGERVSLDIYIQNGDGDRPILSTAIVETHGRSLSEHVLSR